LKSILFETLYDRILSPSPSHPSPSLSLFRVRAS